MASARHFISGLILNEELSSEAVRLYMFFYLNVGEVISNEYVRTKFNWSLPKITRVKRELKNAGLLAVKRVTGNEYVYYWADENMSANEKMEDNND